MNELEIYGWGAPPIGDLRLRAAALQAAGLTVVDWDPDQLDLLPEFGLKGMVHKPDLETVRRIAGHPALWGYHCGDEPYPEEAFQEVARQFEEVREADPRHPAFLNMLSTTGHFLRTFMEVARPDILSFDYYQWWWGSDRFYEKLEQFREAALLAGVPLGSCLEGNADPHYGGRTYLEDNAVKVRQSVYANLAYGVTMIEWFNTGMMIDGDTGELTPSGRDIAAVNAEVQQLALVLSGLVSRDVYHTPPLPRGTRESPTEYWVRLLPDGPGAGVVQGMFQDEAGTDYMLVANRDYRHAQSVAVRLQSKWLGLAPWNEPRKYSYQVEQFRRATGEWVTLDSSSFVGFTFVLGAGDGELFRIATKVE